MPLVDNQQLHELLPRHVSLQRIRGLAYLLRTASAILCFTEGVLPPAGRGDGDDYDIDLQDYDLDGRGY